MQIHLLRRLCFISRDRAEPGTPQHQLVSRMRGVNISNRIVRAIGEHARPGPVLVQCEGPKVRRHNRGSRRNSPRLDKTA